MLVAVTIGVVLVRVNGGTAPPTIVEHGVATVTIIQGQPQGGTNVVFPVVFPSSSTPNVTLGGLTAYPPTTSISLGSLPWFASNSQTWTSFPATQTEWMGMTDHRIGYTLQSGYSTQLMVDCSAASNTAGATLAAQYSSDGGVTWNNLGTGAVIDSTKCPGTSLGGAGAIPTSIYGVPILLRIVGQGGGGSGDNPAFTVVSLNLKAVEFLQCETVQRLVSYTGFTLTITCLQQIAQSNGVTFSVRWDATD